MPSRCPLVGDPLLTSPTSFDVLVIEQGSAELVRAGRLLEPAAAMALRHPDTSHCRIRPPATALASCCNLAAGGSTFPTSGRTGPLSWPRWWTQGPS